MKQIKITLAEIAEKRNMTVDEIKVIISDRIKFGMTSSNPEIRAQWKKYHLQTTFLLQRNGFNM